MSGILKRTVFYDKIGEYVLPLDFAVVQTEIGAMLEPKTSWFERKSIGVASSTTDATDMMNMVNEITMFPIGKEKLMLADSQVNGGKLWFRIGQ